MVVGPFFPFLKTSRTSLTHGFLSALAPGLRNRQHCKVSEGGIDYERETSVSTSDRLRELARACYRTVLTPLIAGSDCRVSLTMDARDQAGRVVSR
jgi:hypothetical protein